MDRVPGRAEKYPKVAALFYELVTREPLGFMEEAHARGEFVGFDFEFKGHHATFKPQFECKTEVEARARLDPALEAWHIQTMLYGGSFVTRFAFRWCAIDSGDGLGA